MCYLVDAARHSLPARSIWREITVALSHFDTHNLRFAVLFSFYLFFSAHNTGFDNNNANSKDSDLFQ